jgi:biopolymer transport protein ExbD
MTSRSNTEEHEPGFQIAPMIDILLVLLVFFMSISSTEILQQNQNVDLPVAREAKPVRDASEVIVNVLYTPINQASTIEVEERIMTSQDLVALLKSRLAVNPHLRVLMRANRQVRYEFLRSLLESIGESGVGDVTFSVLGQDGNAEPQNF